MSAGHRAYVTSSNRGNGRYSYSYTCSCGRQGGGYSNRSGADKAARKHEAGKAR